MALCASTFFRVVLYAVMDNKTMFLFFVLCYESTFFIDRIQETHPYMTQGGSTGTL